MLKTQSEIHAKQLAELNNNLLLGYDPNFINELTNKLKLADKVATFDRDDNNNRTNVNLNPDAITEYIDSKEKVRNEAKKLTQSISKKNFQKSLNEYKQLYTDFYD